MFFTVLYRLDVSFDREYVNSSRMRQSQANVVAAMLKAIAII